MSERAIPFHRRRFLKTAVEAGAVLAAPAGDSGHRAGQRRRGAAQRADRAGRHRHRRPRLLRPGLLPAASPTCGSWPSATCRPTAASASRRWSTPSTATRTAPTYRDFRELLARHDIDAVLITTGSNWHATAVDLRGQGRQGRVLREALHEDHRPEPGPGRDVPPHGPRLPGRHAAAEPAALRVRRRAGPAAGSSASSRRSTPIRPAWAPARAAGPPPSPSRPRRRSTGTCTSARRPGGRSTRGLLNSGFEKGGGMVGGGVPGMGLALRRPVPVGQQRRRHGPGRVLPRRERPGDRPLRQRREAGRPQRRLAAAGLLPRAVRGRHRLGRDGRQRQAGPQLAGAAGRHARSPRSAATRPPSTSAISSTA